MAANRTARPGKQPVRESAIDTRVFVVVGPRPVAGAEKGEKVTATLTIQQADALVAAGHIAEESSIPFAAEERVDLEKHQTAGVDPVVPDGEPTTDQVEPVRPVEDGADEHVSALAPEEAEAVRDEVRATLEEAGLVRHAENPTKER